MKTAVSVVLLLAGLSAGAVGVGYVLRRRGEGAAAPTPQPAPGGSTTTTPQPAPGTVVTPTPAPTIAIGEPVAPVGNPVYAGGSPGFDERHPPGGFVLAGSPPSVPATVPAAPASPFTDEVAARLAKAIAQFQVQPGSWLGVIRPQPITLPVAAPVSTPAPTPGLVSLLGGPALFDLVKTAPRPAAPVVFPGGTPPWNFDERGTSLTA